jgi:hypothetical protein
MPHVGDKITDPRTGATWEILLVVTDPGFSCPLYYGVAATWPTPLQVWCAAHVPRTMETKEKERQ